MTRDIKQRQTHIKDIKTLDHAESLKRNIRNFDIKTKPISEEQVKQNVESNEGQASDKVVHGSKKVVLQEFYSASNIHDKVSSIKQIKAIKRANINKASDKGVDDKKFDLKKSSTEGIHNKNEFKNDIKALDNKKDIKTGEYRKSIKTKPTKRIERQPPHIIKQSNTAEKCTLLNTSNASYKIKTRVNPSCAPINNISNIKNINSSPSSISKFKSVNKIFEKKGIKKIFLNVKKSVQKAIEIMKSLTTILSLGASTFVLVIILICIVCIIVSSPFSIFFSNDTESGDNSLQHAIVEVNKEYNKQIRQVKSQYNDVEQTSTIINNDKDMRMRDVWQNVLLVYTIRTYSQDRNSLYFDSERIKELQDIFFQCVSIHGSMNEEKKILTIQVSVKLYSEIAFSYEEQKMLSDLMDGKNDYLWNNILDGISIGNGSVVDTALNEVGNVGGQPYWSWYGFTSRVEWCACFVSWVAEQNGYIESGVIPKFASVEGEGIPWFQRNNQWEKRGYEPSAGDIIFFDWDGDDYADHVGIVEKCENGIVYTIEGNSIGDECRQRDYPIDSIYIKGYGIPNY